MYNLDLAYAALVDKTLLAPKRETRNGTTRSHFGVHFEIDMRDGTFPLLLGRKIFYRGVLGELAAFLQGPKTVKDFKDMGCNYWDAWGDTNGNIEVDYGNSWLNFNGTNQLYDTIRSIIKDPTGRRHLISGWRPDRLKDLSLPCCHYSYQWYVSNDGYLDIIWNQRSVDLMVGLPSDFVLAAAWNILMAGITNYKPGVIHFMLGDTHIYETHLDSTIKYLNRCEDLTHKGTGFMYPSWELKNPTAILAFRPEDIQINSYIPEAAIKFSLEV